MWIIHSLIYFCSLQVIILICIIACLLLWLLYCTSQITLGSEPISGDGTKIYTCVTNSQWNYSFYESCSCQNQNWTQA